MIDPSVVAQLAAMPPEAQAPTAPPVPSGPVPEMSPMGAIPPVPGAVPLPEPGEMPPMSPIGATPPPPKKPPLLLPPRLARQLAQGYVDHARQLSEKVAEVTGPPDDFERFPLKEQVSAWYKRDVRVDPLALKEQGLSDVEIRDKVYPLRRILLKMAGPRPTDRVKFVQRMLAERAKAEQARAATI